MFMMSITTATSARITRLLVGYSTTNRKGYREYKSKGYVCKACPYLEQCTQSRDYVKLVTRHVWEKYMECCEDIRHTRDMKAIYNLRKETIKRILGTAKEYHGFKYTQLIGKARMRMKAGLTYAYINLKKLARMMHRNGFLPGIDPKKAFLIF